jgi:small conductance mechanosensitive channel
MKNLSFKFILAGLLALLLTLGIPHPVLSQAPPLPEAERALADSAQLLARNINGVVYHPVRLDGNRLFEVAAAEANQSGSSSAPHAPLRRRVRQIEDQFRAVLKTGFNPDALDVGVSKLNNEWVIVASDGEQLKNTVLVTVTNLDATLHGTRAENLANRWAEIINSRLLQAWQERQPEYLYRQAIMAAALGLVLVLVSLAIWLLQRKYRRQWNAMEQELIVVATAPGDEGATDPNAGTSQTSEEAVPQPQNSPFAASETTGQPAPATISAIDYQQMQARQHRIAFIQLLLDWLQVGLWIGGISTMLILFPYTRRAGYWILLEPLSILLIWLLVSMANRFSALAIDRGIQAWANRRRVRVSSSHRHSLRIPTFTRALRGMATFLLVALGILLTMDAMGVSIGPFLAGAGILGFAITWSSQTLMKDVIMGMLILLEDQFAVGDVISLGDMGGFVENMNLRITQLRDANGQLITVSNSMITSVRNLSKDWARVDLSVPIPYDKDMPGAMHLIQQTAERMCADPEWKEAILDAPQLLGVDAFNENGFVVRLWIQTQPLKQWDVERELRRRLKLALDAEDIPIGVPQQEVWLRSAEQNGERVHA